MSRSEFFSRAAERYLDELDSDSVTQQIDHAVAELGHTDVSGKDAVDVGRRLLSRQHRRLVIERGAIYWADLGQAKASRPAKRRPVLVISADTYNRSRLATVLAAVITSNTRLAAMPGNVFLPTATTGLPQDSVVNVTALVTLNKTDLADRVGNLSGELLATVDRGLRRVLNL